MARSDRFCIALRSISSFLNNNSHSPLRESLLKGGLCRGISNSTDTPSPKNYYDLFGVNKDATPSEINKAYDRLSEKLNKDDPKTKKIFQLVHNAYEILIDDQRRQQYDQLRVDTFEKVGNGDGAVIETFGSGSRVNKFLFDDSNVLVELSFMEAVQGCSKTIKFLANLACDTCGGTRFPPLSTPCGGAGQTVPSLCSSCKGERFMKKHRTVKFNVMAGVDNNDVIKIPGSGGIHPVTNQPKDLYVVVKVREDPVFRREGEDIHVDACLSITQAVLGATIKVPTLTGDVEVKVPPGTETGQTVVLREKGIKCTSVYFPSYGDEYVHFKISIPKNISQRQLHLFEELAKEDQREDDKGESRGIKGASYAREIL